MRHDDAPTRKPVGRLHPLRECTRMPVNHWFLLGVLVDAIINQ